MTPSSALRLAHIPLATARGWVAIAKRKTDPAGYAYRVLSEGFPLPAAADADRAREAEYRRAQANFAADRAAATNYVLDPAERRRRALGWMRQ